MDRTSVDLPALAVMLSAILVHAPRSAFDVVAAALRPQLGERAWAQLMAAVAPLPV